MFHIPSLQWSVTCPLSVNILLRGPPGIITGISNRRHCIYVAESTPRCTSNLTFVQYIYTVSENEAILMVCRVQYSGMWPPVARWQQLDSLNRTIAEQSQQIELSNNYTRNKELIFQFTVKISMKSNNTTFSCTIYFDLQHKPRETTAGNIPDYSYTWMSDTVNVRNVQNAVKQGYFFVFP